jgi:5-methyltetrahydropteroyltriglutamate--homocysteine methyltransferase
MLKCQLTGTFARSPELIRATRDYDRGRLKENVLERIREDDVKNIINFQEDFQYIIDGGFLWQDILRPFTFVKGIESGPLTRFFRTNTFYRKPIIKGDIQFKSEFIDKFFYLHLLPERSKVIFPGPVSFVGLSDDKYGKDTLFMIAGLLNRMVKHLEEEKVSCVQFSEPYISLTEKRNFNLWKKAYEILTENIEVDTLIHLPWGNFSNLLDILKFPVRSIGIDFIETSIEKVDFKTDKRLGIGCIDAQNSLLEDTEDLRKFVDGLIDKLSPEDFFICPNCDLEFLPYSIAIKKIKTMREISDNL